MKKDYTIELAGIIGELMDKRTKPAKLYMSECKYFSRIGRSGRPFCQASNNKRVICRSRSSGQPYFSYLANCSDCQKGVSNE